MLCDESGQWRHWRSRRRPLCSRLHGGRMSGIGLRERGIKAAERSGLLLAAIGCGGLLARGVAWAQTRESLAGERAAQALKSSIEAEAKEYNLRYGPVRYR